jgi:hypothetical protein
MFALGILSELSRAIRLPIALLLCSLWNLSLENFPAVSLVRSMGGTASLPKHQIIIQNDQMVVMTNKCIRTSTRRATV